ncbi:MAG: ATP-grasp domain-containing protein [Prochloraceae cyanobacterium]
MDLLEYQAKELFSKVGIPLLPSQPIEDPRQLKRLQIPYPVVLKSQVRARGRGKAGGIHFVENTIDAIAAAQAIFNLSIMGQYPQVLLAEARYNSQEEFFLAVVLDYQLKRPVLLGSAKGGIEVEPLLENLQKVVVEEEFSSFYARRLTIKMGIKGKLIESVSAIVEKMYRLFVEQDLDLVEINPLGVSPDGEVMALDGKITVNDSALVRHHDLIVFQEPKKLPLESSFLPQEPSFSSPSLSIPEPRWLDWKNERGNIGIIGNSLGLALVSWDLIAQNKGKASCCLLVGEKTTPELLPNSYLAQQLKLAVEQMLAVKGLKAILVNIIGSPEISEIVASTIADCLQIEQPLTNKGEETIRQVTGSRSRSAQRRRSPRHSSKQRNQLQWVIRLVGGEIDPIKEHLADIPVHWTSDLEEAISKTISLAKYR